MEAIRTDDSHWLLHLLKESDVDQEDLDRAVHAAAWKGHPDSVRMLLAAGASVYSINQHGQPLLVEAVFSANPHAVRAILQVSDVTNESRMLHYLLPAKREANLASRLRCTTKYPTVRVRTNRFKNSFIPYYMYFISHRVQHNNTVITIKHTQQDTNNNDKTQIRRENKTQSKT